MTAGIRSSTAATASLLREGLQLAHAPAATSHIKSVGEAVVRVADEARGILNDASRLNRTTPMKIFRPTSVEEVELAASWARNNNVPITMGGSRHSLGRQQLLDDAVHIDMRGLNRMSYDATKGTLLVQPGATWAEIQRFLDPLGRSPKVMQSSNVFTVGGSLATNIHGRDIRFGPIADTVESIALLKPDGTRVVASRTQNAELFEATIGGFGLTGTVLEAELKTVPNEMYKRSVHNLPLSGFDDWYKQYATNPSSRLMQARIDPINMREMHIVTFDQVPHDGVLPALHQKNPSLAEKIEVLPFKLAVHSKTAKRGYWWMYSHLDNGKIVGSKPLTRNQAMSQSIEFLGSNSKRHTQTLQEYFVPPEKLTNFIDGLRIAAKQHNVNVLNLTVRNVEAEASGMLSTAKDRRFAVVVYFDQLFSDKSQAAVDRFTSDAADAAISQGGTFYLPYRLTQSSRQAHGGYPEIDNFFATQRRIDPAGTYDNGLKRWYEALEAEA